MRCENEVFKELLDFAIVEDKVRVVILNGSRVNKNAPKDVFQDYDIVFSVTEPEFYLKNQEWIKRFGELVIMQQNNAQIGGRNKYIFLMQFKDGVRIDLNFNPVECIDETISSDSLTKVLLDKDGITGDVELPNESTYFVKKPTELKFNKVMNEALWIQTYIAKGIWRDEFPLARYMHDVIIQDCIIKLLSWHIGIQYDWKINVGKCGKWFKRYLPYELYEEFLNTYSTRDYEEMWTALFNSGRLIRKIGSELAEKLGYSYPIEDDLNVTEYIKKIKDLDKDAIDFN